VEIQAFGYLGMGSDQVEDWNRLRPAGSGCRRRTAAAGRARLLLTSDISSREGKCLFNRGATGSENGKSGRRASAREICRGQIDRALGRHFAC
jgi:hypothetical protein